MWVIESRLGRLPIAQCCQLKEIYIALKGQNIIAQVAAKRRPGTCERTISSPAIREKMPSLRGCEKWPLGLWSAGEFIRRS